MQSLGRWAQGSTIYLPGRANPLGASRVTPSHCDPTLFPLPQLHREWQRGCRPEAMLMGKEIASICEYDIVFIFISIFMYLITWNINFEMCVICIYNEINLLVVFYNYTDFVYTYIGKNNYIRHNIFIFV